MTERKRPVRIAWESLRGVELNGSFELAPADFGTTVVFRMEYRLHSRFLALVVEPLLEPLIRKVAAEVIEEVRKRLRAANL